MFTPFKEDWKQLKASEPGHRFQDRYKRRHQPGKHRNSFKTSLIVGAGLLIIGVGILLLIFPGPGWITIVVGLAFIAGESLFLARILDILEMVIRKMLGKQRDAN